MKKRHSIRCIFLVSLALWGVPALAAPATDGGTQIVLSLVGDCALGSEDSLRDRDTSFDSYIARHGYAYPFSKVQQVLGQDDVTIINLESVLYPYQSNKRTKTYNFRGPPDFAQILPQGSVELAFLGNNHTMDYGMPGFQSTVDALQSVGTAWFGVTDHSVKTWIYEKNGVKVGFTGLNYTYWHREKGAKRVQQSFQELKDAGCDFIVAVMHAGSEYAQKHNWKQQRLSRFLLSQGAGLVVGHHPHVLHGVEVVGHANVVYSLGNFAFGGNAKLRVTETMIAQVTLHFDEEGSYAGQQLNLIPAFPSSQLEYNDFQPVLAHGDDARRIIENVSSVSPVPLKPYQEGIGAVQDFVPAPQSHELE